MRKLKGLLSKGKPQNLFILFLILIPLNLYGNKNAPYWNTDLSVDERVADLVSRMTLEEKISQMSHLAPAIVRLGVIAYEPNFYNPFGEPYEIDKEEVEKFKNNRPWENYEYWEEGECLDGGWWNEALHGVARAGLATAFPQSIGLGSTWNPELIQKMGNAISDEARVHHNVYGKKLTFWSPTINILRDPRWGRTEESYSEDPYLLSSIAVAFVKGMQGDHPRYLKAIATPKHFVANNSEFNRHYGSSNVSERVLMEYYLQSFKACITRAGAFSVMGAYNALNGVPCCANRWLLTDVLRGKWGFEGYVVSDCGAISDIVHKHRYETNPEKAVALAVKAGCDLECETCEDEQFMYDKYLLNAVKKGYLREEEINQAVTRLFRARFLLGEFDPPEMVPYNSIPESKLDCLEHRELALEVARESIVLLKNDNNTLPLDKETIKSIAVIGPNADVAELGGYSATPAFSVTTLDGIRQKIGHHKVYFEKACLIDESIEDGLVRVAKIAAKCDAAIVVLGTNLEVADEGLDRTNLKLPSIQEELIRKVKEANPKTIIVLINGMPLAINWAKEHIPSIVEAWYPGQSGGTAIADVLFGDYNPGGKLPVTFYKSVNQLPPLDDYDITKGRTYLYLKEKPLFPFGHGLSYTKFKYSNLKIRPKKITSDGKVNVSVDVQNVGTREGDEVVQLYVRDVVASVVRPIKELKGFKRINIGPKEKKKVTFTLLAKELAFWDVKKNKWVVEPGIFELMVGSSSKDIRLKDSFEVL